MRRFYHKMWMMTWNLQPSPMAARRKVIPSNKINLL
jgi:hypothetical protein